MREFLRIHNIAAFTMCTGTICIYPGQVGMAYFWSEKLRKCSVNLLTKVTLNFSRFRLSIKSCKVNLSLPPPPQRRQGIWNLVMCGTILSPVAIVHQNILKYPIVGFKESILGFRSTAIAEYYFLFGGKSQK